MAKTITVTIDPQTAEFSVDLNGFHGKGCADIARMFDGLGKNTKNAKKPEYNQQTCNLQTK